MSCTRAYKSGAQKKKKKYNPADLVKPLIVSDHVVPGRNKIDVSLLRDYRLRRGDNVRSVLLFRSRSI
jgi:hypothetical protein